MNRRLKIAIITVLALIVVGIAVFIIFALRSGSGSEDSAPKNSTETEHTNTKTTTNNGLPQNGTLPGNTEEDQGNEQTAPPAASTSPRDTALRLARLFIERYGSFSKNNNYENVKNLLSLMTPSFRAASEKIIADAEPQDADAEFYGITTKVLTISMEEYAEDARAVVKLQTQRAETKGTNDPAIFTQGVTVALKSVDSVWKVDSVTWE